MSDETVFTRAKRIRSAKLTMPQTFYLITLNEFIGKNSDAWPSQATIADRMNSSLRSVKYWQTELEKMGVIVVASGKGCKAQNRYSLCLDALQPKPTLNSATHAPFNTETDSEWCNTCTDNGATHAPGIGQDVPTERTVERTKKEQAFSFPEKLNNAEFKNAWNQWVTFRREIKKKLTPSTVSRQLALLETLGSVRAVQSIENSIRNSWQGLFDPDGKQGGKASPAASDADAALANVLTGLRRFDYETDRKGLRAFIGEKAWTVASKVGWQRIRNRDQFTEKQIRTDFVAAWGAGS